MGTPQAYKTFYKKQAGKLQPQVSRQGVITKINIPAWCADVQVVGGNQSVLKNVPMSSAVPLTVQVGDKCVLDTLGEHSPSSGTGGVIIAYTYGRTPTANNFAASGYVTVPANSTAYQIQHGLGVIPNIVSISLFVGGIGAGGGTPSFVWVSTSKQPDSQYIYVDSGNAPRSGVYWAAAYVV